MSRRLSECSRRARLLCRALTASVVIATFGGAESATATATATIPPPPDGTGAPSEPAPLPSTPPTPPAPQEIPTADVQSTVFGACADQGPLIGGQVVARVLVAVPERSQVVRLSLRAEGASIREIEIPYHGWTVERTEEALLARVAGEPEPVDHFWFWAAFVDVTADEIELEMTAELLDGRVVSHNLSEPSTAPSDSLDGSLPLQHPLVRIPVDRDALPTVSSDASTAGTTPSQGREPCRLGSRPTGAAAQTEDGSSGNGGLPWSAALLGLGGLLAGVVAGRMLPRRR